MATWTLGDRQARFEQTVARHAGLSQFAAPFLSRMTFADEHADVVSPTLSNRCRSTAHTARRDAEAYRPPDGRTSPRRRCSRSSATTARPTGAAGNNEKTVKREKRRTDDGRKGQEPRSAVVG